MPPSSRDRRLREERSLLLTGIVIAGFSVIAFGLLRLQVAEHESYRDLAKNNRVRLEVLRAPRGQVFDRSGELLVDNRPSFTIVFRPFPAESLRRIRKLDASWYARVGGLLEMDSTEVHERVTRAGRRGQSEILRENVPFAILAAVEEAGESLPGVEVQVQPLRRYPNGSMLGHLLGYAGEINDRELETRAELGYRPGDLIGRSGIERSYESELRGIDGAEFVVVNAMGQRVSILSEGPPRLPIPGRDLVLTIDMKVQRAMEEAMADVPRGAAVAIDPRDGAVLGMVSRPPIDPNEFSEGLSVARWREISGGGANPLLNRAIQGQYPPGSTFKIVSMLAALDRGIATPDTRLAPCTGSYVYGGRAFGCWKKTGHGTLDFIGALQHSCDVYYYQIGPKLGLERLGAVARQFGLGEATGIDIPQELGGLVPDRAWYAKRIGRFRDSQMLNLIIGQGELLTTPLQLALMAAETANGGREIRPHIVREVKGGGAPKGRPPRTGGFRTDARNWDAVHAALEKVINEGTGGASRVHGVRVAGKTGTAQNPHGEDHALFVCYAPADRPEIALSVVLENAGHGGSEAAPRAGRILRQLFLPDSLQRPVARAQVQTPAPVTAEDDLGD